MGALIFAVAITSVSSILYYSRVDAQTSSTAASGPASKAAPAAADTKDKNFDLSTISKAIGDEASRLKNDAAGWNQRMQELDLNKSQQDDELPRRTSTKVSLFCKRLPADSGQMQKPGSHCANRRLPFESSRAVRRCIHFLRFARLPVISNRRPLNCTL
jgi:hypothetical protein